MTSSFKRIDYSLRPAKHAERRMLCDIFRRLHPFGKIEEYVYVGFGSIWFADFILMHRALGIKDMISIEHSESAEARIEENKPFRIPVDYRESKEVLPDLDWSRNQFLWLDYDDPLSTDMLLDMRSVAMRASSGSVLAVSVQCARAPHHAEAERDPTGRSAIERFVDTFGRERVPPQTKTEDLFGWPLGTLSRELLLREIQSELAIRNALPGDNIRFVPICEIEYEDGAKMTTLVGIFVADSEKELLERCHFNSLDFLQRAKKTVRIAVPKLTLKEFKKLESQLPLPAGQQINLGTIPAGEAGKFLEMYRYLPNFAVLEG